MHLGATVASRSLSQNMLEANRDRTSLQREPDAVTVDEVSAADTFAYAIGVARRQIWVILLFAILAAGLSTIFLLTAGPNYTATATLLIDTRKIEISQQPSVSADMPIQAVGAMESQVEILKSDEIALAVIKKLGLWKDPKFIGTGKPGLVGALVGRFFPSEKETDARRAARALVIFKKNLTASRIGNTFAIEIEFEAKEAGLAAQVANAVAEAYIDQQLTTEHNAARQASDWLENRIQQLRGQSDAAQRAVVAFKEQHDIVETDKGELINNQRLTELNAQLNAAHQRTIDAKAKFDQLDAITRADAPDAIANAPIGDGPDNALINTLRNEYFVLSSKEADSSTKYGHNNPAIVSIRNQKAQIRSELLAEFRRLTESHRSDYEAAVLREAAIKKEYSAAVAQSQVENQALVQLRQEEASARAYQDLYNALLTRYNASLQQLTAPVTEASIISRAAPTVARSYKKTVTVAALILIGGLGLGVGVALLRELLAGRAFLTSKSVQSRLNIACIGVLPNVEDPKKKLWRPKQSSSGAGGKNVVRGDKGISWTVVDYPLSRFSESVRSIKLAIDLDNRQGSGKVIGFTSAIPNEGKSTVALAVGQLIARNRARVIVVDCDLRNPSLTRAITPDATSGIVELNFGEVSFDEIIWKDRSTRMEFLPAVPHAGPPNSSTILASIEMKRVFDELRQRYDYVIVDLSPLSPVIDVCATTELIDAYVLVIEWGRTGIDLVEHALRAAPNVSESLLGAVLNKADIRRLGKYDPYQGGYYYGSEYQRG